MKFIVITWLLACSGWLALSRAHAAETAIDPNNVFLGMTLEKFFPGGPNARLNCYLQRRDGRWIAGIGSPTFQGRPQWNTALMPLDASGLNVTADKVTGRLLVTLIPDPWIPDDQQVRVATVTIDGTFVTNAITGTWQVSIPGSKEELAKFNLFDSGSGNISGGTAGSSVPELSDASYDFQLYNLIPSAGPVERYQRRRAISVGIQSGKAISARLGQLDVSHRAYDYQPIGVPTSAEIQPDEFKIALEFEADDLDGMLSKFVITLQGRRVIGFLVGEWQGTIAGKPARGFFRGNVGNAAAPAVAADPRPWYVPTAGYQPLQPGEHPRLFFRKSDLPELRRRAATPDGQFIVKRLRELLNGSDGESMPTVYNPATKGYSGNKFTAVPGTYSISHGAGFGFLYQLTGDKKYADLARQCVEKAFAGQRDMDDRYSWTNTPGELRAGPSIGWTAVAYDLCYDAWPVDFRQRVALAIQNYADKGVDDEGNPIGISLRRMVLTPNKGPASNHYGAIVGGCGLAVLAILNDPGTDPELLETYRRKIEINIIRHLSAGWGDGGYYNEGPGASRVGTQAGFLSLLQAMKVSLGKDFLNGERLNASHITMVPRSMMVLGPPGYFPYRSSMGPTYGTPNIGDPHQRAGGISHGGYFSEGFGAIADKHKPALLWTVNRIFNDQPFDTMSLYPHRAMLALINWPTFTGITEKNPAEVMPLVVRDRLYEHFVFRNRYQDTNDVVTTLLFQGNNKTRPRGILVYGLGGLRLELHDHPMGPVSYFVAGKDGSGSIARPNYAFAIDYSRASGADAVIAYTVPANAKPITETANLRGTILQVGSSPVCVVTLAADGRHPELKVDGSTIIAGKQKLTLADGKFNLAVFTPDERVK